MGERDTQINCHLLAIIIILDSRMRNLKVTNGNDKRLYAYLMGISWSNGKNLDAGFRRYDEDCSPSLGPSRKGRDEYMVDVRIKVGLQAGVYSANVRPLRRWVLGRPPEV